MTGVVHRIQSQGFAVDEKLFEIEEKLKVMTVKEQQQLEMVLNRFQF